MIISKAKVLLKYHQRKDRCKMKTKKLKGFKRTTFAVAGVAAACVLGVSVLAGCGNKKGSDAKTNAATTQSQTTTQKTTQATTKAKEKETKHKVADKRIPSWHKDGERHLGEDAPSWKKKDKPIEGEYV